MDAPSEEAVTDPLKGGAFVTVEDCEKVTRQLQFALEVDGADYARLEVSSPGIDRPLRHEQDFQRFEGEVIDVTLKAPIGAAAAGQVNANRKVPWHAGTRRGRWLANRLVRRACAKTRAEGEQETRPSPAAGDGLHAG